MVYRASDPAQPITNLVDNATYFVIADANNPDSLKLAKTQAEALAGTAIGALGAIPGGTAHSLAAAVTFTGIQNLLGGSADDTFTLVLQSVRTFAGSVLKIDGGVGSNTLQAKLDATAAPQPGDQLVWTVTGANVGWVAGRDATFLTLGAQGFDQTAINGKNLALPVHQFATGQAVVYRKVAGDDIPQLDDDTVYYVIRKDDRTIQLTANPNPTAADDGFDLTAPNVASSYTLTPIDARTTSSFTGDAVSAANTITLGNHGLTTGQAVVYRSGGGDAVKIAQLTTDGVYYVIKVDDNTLQLAANIEEALAGTNIAIANPGDASRHSLTRVFAFGNLASLAGDTEADTFALRPGGGLTGAIDGGAGASNTLRGPDVVAKWTVTDVDRGSLTDANDQALLTSGFTRVGHLLGGTASDRFTLQGNGRLTGSIAGGAGFNTLQGPDDDLTWSVFDRTLNRSDRVAFDAAASTFGVTAVNNDALTIGNHTLVTGQAVVYHASDVNQAIANLVDATTYFAIVDPSQPDTVKLAPTQAAALANTPIVALGAIANGTTHTLTAAMLFSDIQGLQGGSANDTFTLVAQTVSPFVTSILRIDGGAGSNALAAKLDSNAVTQPTDELIWSVTGADAGWLADPSGKFLITAAAAFAQSAVGTDKSSLTLPSHRWQTGQAVVYHKQAGADAGLTDNTVYYVIRVDADTIKLAANAQAAVAGTAIATLVAQGAGTHVLTAIDARQTSQFAGAAVHANAITLNNHGLQTGQAVMYRAGGGDALRLAQLDNETVYYVIKVDDNTLKLATTLDGALSGGAIAIENPGGITQHSLTRVFAFANAGTLTGDRETDTFALRDRARLSGSIDGGAGFNTVAGPDANATWTAFDRTLDRFDRMAFDAATSQITAVTGGNTLTVGAHSFRTGEAVVYRSSDAVQPITNLTADTTYFVIRASDTTVQLAATRDDALGNRPIGALGAIAGGTTHSLTAAVIFAGAQGLLGGTANDKFNLTMAAFSPLGTNVLQMDGGIGTNTFAVRSAAAPAVQPADELSWAVTGNDAGWVVDRTGKFLATQAAIFAKSAVGADKTTLTLPHHQWQTGQALVYHKQNANGITDLTDDTVYYVIRVDDDTIKLATSAPNATGGTAITTLVAQGAGNHALIAIDGRANASFTGAAVDAAAHAIQLNGHGLSTGQAVVYRAGSGEAFKIAELTSDTRYYAIKIDDNTIKLAASLEQAIAGNAIAITKPADASRHSLTRVLGFQSTSHLAGDREDDTLRLVAKAALTGSWDGGGGRNSARVQLDPAAVVEGTDERVWAVVGEDSAGGADRQADFLANSVVKFDQTAVEVNGDQIVLRGHRLQTGQVVVFHKESGAADIGLMEGAPYYVIRVDSNTVKLARSVQEMVAGTTVALTKPAANTVGAFRFTPIDARTVNGFAQEQVDNAQHRITLHHHSLSTGQAVVFHVQAGTALTNTSDNTTYYVVKVDDDTIQLALNAANAAQGMTLDIASTGANNSYTLTAQDSLVTKVFNETAVTVANAVTLANHGLLTGQAVLYRAGIDTAKIAQLTNNNIYFVIKIDDDTIKLASTLSTALAGAPIAIAAPLAGSQHSLTRVLSLSKTGALIGDREPDTVSLLGSGRLTGLADGGAGFNTLVGPDVNTTWASFDPVLKLSDRLVRSDDATSRVSGVAANSSLTLQANPHGFQTGDAVAYRATVVDLGGGKSEIRPIVGLKDDRTYFAIRVDDTTIKLAASREDALGDRPIVLGAFDGTGSGHNVHRAVALDGFQSLLGGTADDAFGLVMKTVAGFDVDALGIDGGSGTNTLRTQLDTDAVIADRDELLWTMTGSKSGWVSDRQAQLSSEREFTFKGAVVNADSSITLPSHQLVTGQALLYKKSLGKDIGGLKDNQTYYAVVIDANTIKLAATKADADKTPAATTIALTVPAAPAAGEDANEYRFTVVSPLSLDRPIEFAAAAIDDAQHTIALPSHKLTTGQIVLFRKTSGTDIAQLTHDKTYYVVVIDADTIKLSATAANAIATPATTIAVTAPAAGADPNKYTVTPLGGSEAFTGDKTRIVDTTNPTTNARTHDRITRTGLAQPFQTGQAVVYHETTAAGIGLTDNKVYFVIRVNERTLKLADTLQDAAAGTARVLTNLAAANNFTLTAKGSAVTFDERQVDSVNSTIHVQHRLLTGQRVVYRQVNDPGVAPGAAVGGLLSGTPYFAIRITDDTIKLAANADDAKNGVAIPLTAPATPNLATGAVPNRYTLASEEPGPAFTIGTTFANGPYQFDVTAVSGTTLVLPSHDLATADAVLYRAANVTPPTGGAASRVPIKGLTDNIVYYVIRLDDTTIQLARTADEAVAGKAITISLPGQTATGAHSLTAMGPGTQFSGNLVDANNSTIKLAEHPFQTGQAVIYRADSTENSKIKELTSNTVYYAIRVDKDTIRLAKDALDAVAGRWTKLTKPDDTTHHALTALLSFGGIGKLEGGRQNDTTSLLPTNDARGPLAGASAQKFGHTFTDVNPDKTDLTDANLRGVGGRINDVAGVPGNNTDFYAASEYGGLWKSVDGGRTWKSVTGYLPQVTWDVEVAPAVNAGDVQPVYVTSWFDGRVDTEAGIRVSYDQGASWVTPATARPNPILNGSLIDNTPDPRYTVAAADRFRIDEFKAFGIAVRPDKPEHVVVGTSAGVAISDDAGKTWEFIDPTPANPATDVWGVTYQKATNALPDGIIDIIGDDGHLRSFDGGQTWGYGVSGTQADFTLGVSGTLPAKATGLASIAVSPDESYVIFVVASDENTAAGNSGNDKLYESDNGGATWTKLGNPDIQGRVPFVKTNDRTAGFDLWFGDVNLYRATGTSAAASGGATRVKDATDATKWSFSTTGASSDSGGLEFDLSTPAAVDKIPLLYANDSGIFYNQRNALVDQPSSISIPGHGLSTGDLVEFSKINGADIEQLTDGQSYTVIKVDDDTIRLAEDAAEASANRPLSLTRPANGAAGSYQLTEGLFNTLAFNQGDIPETLWQESTVSPHAMWLFGMAGVSRSGHWCRPNHGDAGRRRNCDEERRSRQQCWPGVAHGVVRRWIRCRNRGRLCAVHRQWRSQKGRHTECRPTRSAASGRTTQSGCCGRPIPPRAK